MTMTIESKHTYLTTNQIHELILLLESPYIPLIKRIAVIDTKWHTLIKMNLDNPILTRFYYTYCAFKGTFAGLQNRHQILLFPFAYQKRKMEISEVKMSLVHTLYHEIRHIYQAIHLKEQYEIAEKTYNIRSSNKGYIDNWIEEDAETFAEKMVEKHRGKIQEILDIKERA